MMNVHWAQTTVTLMLTVPTHQDHMCAHVALDTQEPDLSAQVSKQCLHRKNENVIGNFDYKKLPFIACLLNSLLLA